MVNLIQGDVLECFKKVRNSSQDVIILDPPYNIGKDFGNNSTKSDIKTYINWVSQWLDESQRVLKDSGVIFLYGFSEILAHISTLHPMKKQRWLIWSYKNKVVPSLNFFQRTHESIICMWKSDNKPFFNRDGIRVPYTDSFLNNSAGKVRTDTEGRFSSGTKKTIYKAHINGALPRDVIEVPTLSGGAGSKQRFGYCFDCDKPFLSKNKKDHAGHKTILHPTQKPMKLTKTLIKSSERENLKLNILVPFSGSGSELLVAHLRGHMATGFEINPDYVKMANSILKLGKKHPNIEEILS